LVYDGASRSEGAQAGGVGLQTLRDGVLRFNAAGLVDGKHRRSRHGSISNSGENWRSVWKMAQSQPRTGWCAGG